MVCGIDASLAIYNIVLHGGKCCKLKNPMHGWGWECLSIFSHVGRMDGHCIMTSIEFHIFIISLLCITNLTT